MLSEAAQRVLEVVRRNTGASQPTTADPFPDGFTKSLRTMDPKLLAHPDFIDAQIRAVDRVSEYNKDEVKGALTLASGMVEILNGKNVKHIICNYDARRRGSSSDRPAYRQQNSQEVPEGYKYLRDGPLPRGEYFASDNLKKNKDIVGPGQVIRACTIERARDGAIKFGDPEYISTPTGSALTKPYLELVLYVIGKIAYCRRITSKQGQGLDAVFRAEKSNYLAILPEGSGTEEANGSTNARAPKLFTRDMGSHPGSMLCLDGTTVSLNSWISPQAGHFTDASMAITREAVMDQAHVKHHMADFLTKVIRPQATTTAPPRRWTEPVM